MNVGQNRGIECSESEEGVCVRVCRVWEIVFDDVGSSEASIAAQSAESKLCVRFVCG